MLHTTNQASKKSSNSKNRDGSFHLLKKKCGVYFNTFSLYIKMFATV